MCIRDRDTQEVNEDDLMMCALEAGAEDIELEDGVFEILTDPSDFTVVREELEGSGYTIASSEVIMIPQNYVELVGEDYDKALSVFEKLEDHDDVQNVYHNLKLHDEESEERCV